VVNLLIITHGEFGAYIVEAAETIVGAQANGVESIGISARQSVPEVRARISEAVDRLNGEDGLVIATDIPGGTPSNIALPLVKDKARIEVVSGVNLYMVVTAFNHRDGCEASGLAVKMLTAGKRAVTDVKTLLAARA